MKKFLTVVVTALTATVSACWFTVDNFNGNYIAGANNYHAHYSETAGLADAVYRNAMSVSLPLTVFVKVAPRYPDQPGESAGAKNITVAALQYKVKSSGAWGGWKTVKTLENLNWMMNFNRPVALFGKGTVNPRGLVSGDEIMIRLYLTDGTYETGDTSSDITSTVPATATAASGGSYEGGWTAPFVFRVIFNGEYWK